MEAEGTIINAKLSSCCSTSIRWSQYDEKYYPNPSHYTCNKCGKPCNKIEIPRWIVTKKGKYKEINNPK